MKSFPIFLSVVFEVQNQSEDLKSLLTEATKTLNPIVDDYEIIIIDNASTDNTIPLLKALTEENGIPNLQIFSLTKRVDPDVVCWIGLENSLGDYVAFVNQITDDLNFLPAMLEKAMNGNDVVFARNILIPRQRIFYRCIRASFLKIYELLNNVHLDKDAPYYRILSKRVVNFILKDNQPAVAFRHLPITGGFSRCNLTYSKHPKSNEKKNLKGSIDRGIQLLISSNNRAPMRLVTLLSFFGAIANLMYSIYVVGVGLFKADVAPGWISLSLQISGMFLLISIVLLVLGEYILQGNNMGNKNTQYYIGQEFMSAHITYKTKLNVEEKNS